MSKPRQNSLVDIPSASLSGIPLNLRSAPKTSTGSGPRAAVDSTSSCRASDDDDVFGLKSLSSRGSSVSALSTPAAVATLVQIGENNGGGAGADDSSVFTDWDRLKTEAAAIAGGIAREKSETPSKVLNLDAFSPIVGDSPLLFSGEAKEPPDNLLVSSPEGSPLKPVRLKDEMVAEGGEGASSAASVRGRGGGEDCVGDLISIGESGKENSEPEPPSKCCSCGGGGAAPKDPDNLLTLLDLDLGESSLAPIMFGGDDDDKGPQNRNPAAETAKLATPAKPRLSLVQRQSLSRATTRSTPAAGRRPLGVANSQQKQPLPPLLSAAPAATAKAPVNLNNRRSLLPPAKKQTAAATPLPATPARRPLATPNRQSIARWHACSFSPC